MEEFVSVNVRIKPVFKRKSFQSALEFISTDPPVLLVVPKQQTYNFDKIFTEESSQEDIYNGSVKPLVQRVKEGYNCTIFAYGQTGTGKTYTMGTNPEEKSAGIISRSLEEFFSSDNNQYEYDVHVSFMEIYNEKVFDLLRKEKVPLPVKGLRIEGLSMERVFNLYEAKHILELGGRNRHTGETKQNMYSSRSHAIFSIYFTANHGDIKTSAKLNLVDLAGSESVKKTGTQGNSFQEGININKGLLCIGQVMTALSANLTYIPYRQSIITTILQDSLNKNNYISLIACVKTGAEDSAETIQTLEFAQRVKRMKNKPEINEVIMKYRAEHPNLFHKNVASTPMKRSAATPLKIDCFKKPRGVSTVNSLPVLNGATFNSSKSVSSLSTLSNSESSNFSPVIRKYMSELENTIIDKLQTVIQNTIKRSTRRSTRISSADSKENTPKYSWKQIQNKVSKLVQDEVSQFTTKASRAASSNWCQSDLEHAKKILEYDSPALTESSIDEVFKKPIAKLKRKNKAQTSTPQASPVNSSGNEKVHDKEELIFQKSLKINDSSSNSTLDNDVSVISGIEEPKLVKKSINRSVISPIVPIVRRSTRLSMRRNDFINKVSNRKQETKNTSPANSSKEIHAQNVDSQKLITSFKTIRSVAPRRSVRFSTRNHPSEKEIQEMNISMTGKILSTTKPNMCCCGHSNIKEPKKKANREENSRKIRTREVLQLLNKGDKKQIQKLSTVGPKTADRILLYRHLNGTFKSIKELADIPGWSSSLYDKFIQQNF
ncbi:hypothetical protein HHI36_012742 [Cryptolaemus montrouzieri]|uniref:Kinesin-like protein n=1 Tax=Cryptolaemus montrouzieri TaxID=559131 RepID=A0ABD2NF52_9CUCU